jgi:hypothetical protein
LLDGRVTAEFEQFLAEHELELASLNHLGPIGTEVVLK